MSGRRRPTGPGQKVSLFPLLHQACTAGYIPNPGTGAFVDPVAEGTLVDTGEAENDGTCPV